MFGDVYAYGGGRQSHEDSVSEPKQLVKVVNIPAGFQSFVGDAQLGGGVAF